MRAYECTIAYHPELGADGIQEQLDKTRQVILAQGGDDVQVHEWGVRELAYPIQKQKRAHFYVIEYRGGGQAVSEVERNLRIADPVLRYLTLAVDPNRPPLELAGVRRETAETAAETTEEASAEGTATEAAPEAADEAADEAANEPQA